MDTGVWIRLPIESLRWQLSGGDEEGMNKMFAAFEKGYKQATKSWGRELPDISKQTYDAVQQKFKDYQNSLKSGETEA